MQPVTGVARAAAGAARWTALRVYSLLLTPLLIIAGAFSALATCGVITAFRFHFHVPTEIHFFVAQTRVATFVVGVAAVALGLVFSVTVARFSKLVPGVRGFIVGVQTIVLIVLVVLMFSDNIL